ncbi:MAG: hypothetical protein A3J24_08285 [Deltaproteobacteria bacterium RIFCSPLOWO2_02_FULL_53_8]|nr:MAG: hypothetical protein A3J24_08285 [Deltaproteobacteria bacterium RIFCSPLOWO2_02_FULL_53_8]
MEIDFNVNESGTVAWAQRVGFRRSRVLLREPERCSECNRVFLGLYPVKFCAEHEGLDEI